LWSQGKKHFYFFWHFLSFRHVASVCERLKSQ
jgi:hypothetical protein